MHRLAWRCSNSLDIWCQFSLLADRNRRARPQQTTFTWHRGPYRFIRIPFGLKNAPSTFQHARDVILPTVKQLFALGNLADIFIFRKSIMDHRSHICSVIILSSASSVKLKLKKCLFLHDKIDYVRHVIKLGKLPISEKATEAFLEMKQQTIVTELKSVLNLFTVFPWWYQIMLKL